MGLAWSQRVGWFGHVGAAGLGGLGDHLSEYVEQVRDGARVRILVRGRPVADLIPTDAPTSEGEAMDAHLRDLERRGLIRRGTGRCVLGLLQVGPPLRGPRIAATIADERSAR